MTDDYTPDYPELADPASDAAKLTVIRLTRQLRAAAAEKAEKAKQLKLEHAVVEEEYRPLLARLDERVEHLRSALRSWAEAMSERTGGRWTSESFAAGTVTLAHPTRVTWPDDEAALIAQLAEIDETLLKRTVAIDRKAVTDALQMKDDGEVCIDGQVLVGVTAEVRPELRFTPKRAMKTDDTEGDEG